MNLTLVDFVLTILVGSGALVLLAAGASRLLHRRVEKRAMRRRVVCRLCLHAFENLEGERVIPCPTCGVANETRGI